MKKNLVRGLGIFYMLILILMLLWYVNRLDDRMASDYTYSDFLQDVEINNIAKVSVSQNAEIPTGSIRIYTKTGQEFRLYVTDVNEVFQ